MTIPSVIVAIAIILVVVITTLGSVLVLVVGVTLACRVAVALVIMATLLLVAGHDGGVAIDRLIRALLMAVSRLSDGTVVSVCCVSRRPEGDAGEYEVRLLPQPRLIHSIKLIDGARDLYLVCCFLLKRINAASTGNEWR